MRRTRAEAEQTREAILAAAIEVFLERGVSRATFDQIARAAGVTRGAVYWHFRDKQEIFAVRQQRADAELRNVFKTVIGLAAARGRVAPGWSLDMAARALVLLLNGSVADSLRDPGKAPLVDITISLMTAFIDRISLSPAPTAA
jgi:AcrR family transcriptional regulator